MCTDVHIKCAVHVRDKHSFTCSEGLAKIVPSLGHDATSVMTTPLHLLCIRALAQLFPTRVRLQPPADTATAARHAQQLQADAVATTAEHNFRALSSLAAARK